MGLLDVLSELSSISSSSDEASGFSVLVLLFDCMASRSRTSPRFSSVMP